MKKYCLSARDCYGKVVVIDFEINARAPFINAVRVAQSICKDSSLALIGVSLVVSQ